MELTREQRLSNFKLDLEIIEADLYNKHVESENNRKIKIWDDERKKREAANPNMFHFKSCPNLDLRSKKVVCGIRYVE